MRPQNLNEQELGEFGPRRVACPASRPSAPRQAGREGIEKPSLAQRWQARQSQAKNIRQQPSACRIEQHMAADMREVLAVTKLRGRGSSRRKTGMASTGAMFRSLARTKDRRAVKSPTSPVSDRPLRLAIDADPATALHDGEEPDLVWRGSGSPMRLPP